MARENDNAFWQYSLNIYGRPAVQQTCLSLQDSLGLDVNLALFCCWMASRGYRLPDAAVRDALEQVSDWSATIVGPLREVRCALPRNDGTTSEVAALRQSVKQLELQAERIEQDRLFRLSDTLALIEPPQTTHQETGQDLGVLAANNMNAYLRTAGIATNTKTTKLVIEFLQAVFPETARADIVDVFGPP